MIAEGETSSRLLAAWRRLTAIHPDVTDAGVRESATITANIAAASVPIVILNAIVLATWLRPQVPLWREPLFVTGLFASGLLLVCLALARSRHARWGVLGMPCGLLASIFGLLLVSEGTPWDTAADFFLAVPVIATLTLRPRESIALWLATVSLYGVVLVAQGGTEGRFEVQDRAVTGALLVALPPMLIFGTELRARHEHVIETQAKRLAEGGKEFAALVESGFRREAAVQHEASVARFRADLMNMVAHELKNPITPLRLQARILESMPPDAPAEKRDKAFELLNRNVERLNSQIDHMLEASRLESGTTKLALAETDLAKLVRQATESYRAVAETGGLTVDLQAASTAPVRADASRIAQVLDNLLSNAIKYTPNGGRITVQVDTSPERVAVRVTDTGLGLTPEQMAKLFQPFSKVHAPVRAGMTSTGLGLFIMKGLVELHGGHFGVESPGAGRGSTFWFDLPVSDPVAGNARGSAASDPSHAAAA